VTAPKVRYAFCDRLSESHNTVPTYLPTITVPRQATACFLSPCFLARIMTLHPADETGAQQAPSISLNRALNQPKHDSKVSIATKNSATSTRSHKEYLDTLIPPTQEMLQKIATAQEHKEEEVIMKRLSAEHPRLSEEDRKRAAVALIQRSYRGHRERRMLDGMTLDPSTRWVEAVKEARYRHITEPRARASLESAGLDGVAETMSAAHSTVARQNWKKIGLIARRAGGDEDSDTESEEENNATEEQQEARRKRKLEERLQRQKAAKMMDLQYFLEMVDLKHRYGSNLRTYHGEWKKADTNENFFYWLDYGEGRFLDCQGCPRERLDREQVRYLSKEERRDYLIKIDKDGLLCWAKNVGTWQCIPSNPINYTELLCLGRTTFSIYLNSFEQLLTLLLSQGGSH
jgi:hypothetical protein